MSLRLTKEYENWNILRQAQDDNYGVMVSLSNHSMLLGDFRLNSERRRVMNRLLIVDDNPLELNMLETLLKGNGYVVSTARNGIEALEQLRRSPPDLIISDILMPEMDGFSLCRALKKDAALKKIPFIFYTATYTHPRDEELALSLGAEKFILKPTDPEEFMAILRTIIKKCEAGHMASATIELEEETIYYQRYNEALIRKLEDKMVQIELINSALEQDISERKKVEEELHSRNRELNLCTQVIEQMVESVIITDTEGVLDEGYVPSHLEAAPGDYVMLTVSDSGCGMNKETLARVFEPFFSTKGLGKGTGLGLATVFGIVKQSGGNIWVYSEEGKGTSFKIYLPRVVEPLQELPEKTAAGTELPNGDETILLAEDNESVWQLTRQILEAQGYKVLEAQNGEEALQLANRHSGNIHLLLTDVIMPGMSGKILSENLRRLRHDIKILFMSGYSADMMGLQIIKASQMPFIQKPFSTSQLLFKVREVLNASTSLSP